jgi:hypothetical protein
VYEYVQICIDICIHVYVYIYTDDNFENISGRVIGVEGQKYVYMYEYMFMYRYTYMYTYIYMIESTRMCMNTYKYV